MNVCTSVVYSSIRSTILMFDLVIPCAFFNQLPFTLKFKEQTMLHIIIVKVEDLFFYLTF